MISIDALAPISTIKAKARRIREERLLLQKQRADKAFDKAQQQQQQGNKKAAKPREHKNTFDVNLRR